ncbi:MAG: hypothetical protein WB493_03740 [Anaeromyxobacteraceae bacterium]
MRGCRNGPSRTSGTPRSAYQAWSPEVRGPVRLCTEVGDLLKKTPGASDDEEEDGAFADIVEGELPALREMVAKKRKVDADYFHFFRGEDGDTIELGTDEGAVQVSWADWAYEGTELTPSEDMEDEELEEWFEKTIFGPRQTSTSRITAANTGVGRARSERN